MELWRSVNGFDWDYQVSNQGNVRNLNYRNSGKTRELKKSTHDAGYIMVGLLQNGKQKHVRVHRLVAECFIPNPNRLPQVNHIDEKKNNNNVENLEWVTNKENSNHGTKGKRMADSHRKNGTYKKLAKILAKPVRGTSLSTGEVVEYQSVRSTKENGFNPGCVSNAASGRAKTHKGHIWEYV